MLSPNSDLNDLFAPGAVEAEHVLKMLHEQEDGNNDKEWRAKIFRDYPRRFAHRLAREYEEKYHFESRRDANLYLLDHLEEAEKRQIPLSSTDYDLECLAKKHSEEMRAIAMVINDDEMAVVRLWPLVKSYGIAPPSLDMPNTTPHGILNRLFDQKWWHMRLRQAHARNLEEAAIKLGLVHRHADTYISQESFDRCTEQKGRNRRILSQMAAINDDGQIFMLEHLIEKSVSNPTNRRNELMCRIAGFESIAKDLGHGADFITLTCPSRMHARLSISGDINPNYDGTTPRQAQSYLSKVWSKIRAKLQRDKIVIYGFRIAEPHQDGTPHWHLLVWHDKSHTGAIREIFAHYALEDNGDEKGALKHRFTYVEIEPGKGSAIGYISKYVSKNIDGYAVDQDENGIDAKSSAQRVVAWASTWGIRQFQQFGGAPVTIWRELRRNTATVPEGILKMAYEAADAGDWAVFLKLLGGPAPARKDLPIQLAKVESLETGKYGDPIGMRVIGVTAQCVTLKTKSHQWVIMSVKRLVASFESVSASFGLREPADGGTDACASAQRTDRCGEAALEFCQ